MPLKSLGEFLRLDSGTLSPLLERIEAAGLVPRERSAHDEHSVTVLLTTEGWVLRDRVMSVPLKAFRATGLSLEELIDMRTRLNRLTAALDDSAGEARGKRARRTIGGQGLAPASRTGCGWRSFASCAYGTAVGGIETKGPRAQAPYDMRRIDGHQEGQRFRPPGHGRPPRPLRASPTKSQG
jgi:DNA-binding PadR family transcriptional regulator